MAQSLGRCLTDWQGENKGNREREAAVCMKIGLSELRYVGELDQAGAS